MQVPGSSAAGLLLFILCLETTNAKIVRTRRSGISTLTRSEFLNTHNPRKINNGILSLVENENAIRGTNNNKQTALDQKVEQSEIVLLNTDDMRDLENIEHTLSVVEYEPQKIKKTGKRKTVDAYNNNPDIVVSSRENANLATPEAVNTYYEVPRTVQPKKIIVTPQYYPRVTQETPTPSQTERRSRSRDVDYVYPSPTPKTSKPRSFRTRSPLIPQSTIATDEAKLETVPTPRIAPPQYRPYSLAEEPRKQKYYTDSISTTTFPSDASYSTKGIKRKKSRKRAEDKALNRQEASNKREENYPIELPRVRGPINVESRNKSRKLGLASKYDVAPRSPFSNVRSSKASQEGNLENSNDAIASGGVTRASNYRNSHPNTAKNDGDPSRSYSKVIDPVRDSGLRRKSYNRKDTKESSTIQVNVKDSPLSNDYEKSFKSAGERPSGFYKNHQISPESDSFENKNSSDKSAQENNKYSDESELSVSSKVASGTPSSVDVYQNIKNPLVTLHTANPTGSTVSPYATPNVAPMYSANYVYYPSLLSTLAPTQNFEISTMDPLSGSWTQQLKLNQPKKRNEEVVQEDDEERNQTEEISDGVAEATDNGSDEDGESKETRTYEIHEAPNENHGSERSRESIQDEQHEPESNGDELDSYNKYDKAYRRYAQRYEDKKAEDVLSDGSHDNESHQSAKEGAGGDASGKGGQGKFEKGGGVERKEGHHASDGENGEKGYKSWHEHEKANKGQHDKVRHSNHYDEEIGKEKEEKEEGGYHEEHQEGEKGEKQAEFGEKGEHQKGYSTKGEHSVHKKDEFEKRTEFFDEFNEDGDMEKDGEFYQEHELSKGGSYKIGHHDEDDIEKMYGKEGKYEKGSHHDEDKGHKVKEGKDDHYEHKNMHGTESDHHNGKKWSFKKDDNGDAGDKKQ